MTAVDLADFLLARIAEDEDNAREATPGRWLWTDTPDRDRTVVAADPVTGEWRSVLDVEFSYAVEARLAATVADLAHLTGWGPARVLVECQAKRWIVAEWEQAIGEDADGLWRAVELLVLPFADHPDCRPEWVRGEVGGTR